MAGTRRAGHKGRTRRPDIVPDASQDMQDEPEGATIFDNIRDDAYCVVWWIDPSGKEVVQFKVAPHLLSEEYIQSLCGGGEYRIREKIPNPENGRMEWGRQRRVTIAGPHKVLKEIPQYTPRQPGQALNPPAPVPGAASGRVDINDVMTAGILNLFKTQQDANESVLRAMREMTQPRDSGFKEILVLLAPTLEKLAEGLLNRRTEEKSQMEGIKEMAEAMKNFRDAAGTPTNPANEFLDLIKKVIGVRKLVNEVDDTGGGSDDNSTATERIMEKLAGPLADVLTRGAAEPRGRPAVPATRTTQVAGEKPKPRLEGPVYDLFLATQKKRLLSLAQRNKDAEILAAADFESLPESYMGPLKQWIGQENVFADIMAKNPEFQQYQEWFATYFEALHREFYPEQYEEGEDDDGTDAPGANGTQPDQSQAGESEGAGPGRMEG